MARTSDDRVAWVDAAKGICIVLVVMMHSTLGVEKAAGSEGWLHAVVAFAAPFRMPDFFLVSGLFLSVALTRDTRTFIDRRVVHFLYFFVLWSVIQIGTKLWPVVSSEGAGAAAWFTLRALFWDPIGVMWFLWMLAAFSGLARLFRGLPWLLAALAVALHLAAPLIVEAVERAGLFAGMVDVFCKYLVFFVAGWLGAPLAFRLSAAARSRPALAVAVLTGWALLNGLAVWQGIAAIPAASLVLGVAGASAILAVASLATARENPVGATLAYLGEHSIVIYLAFFLPMVVMRVSLLKIGALDIGTTSLIVTTVSVIVPLVMLAIVEWSGRGRFLFERPAWARIAPARGQVIRRPRTVTA